LKATNRTMHSIHTVLILQPFDFFKSLLDADAQKGDEVLSCLGSDVLCTLLLDEQWNL